MIHRHKRCDTFSACHLRVLHMFLDLDKQITFFVKCFSEGIKLGTAFPDFLFQVLHCKPLPFLQGETCRNLISTNYLTQKANTHLPYSNYFNSLFTHLIDQSHLAILSPITYLTHRDLFATLKFCFFWHTRDDVQFGLFAIWPCHHNSIFLFGGNIIPYLLLHLNIATLLLYRR